MLSALLIPSTDLSRNSFINYFFSAISCLLVEALSSVISIFADEVMASMLLADVTLLAYYRRSVALEQMYSLPDHDISSKSFMLGSVRPSQSKYLQHVVMYRDYSVSIAIVVDG